jgi:hypothetical protein
LPSVTPQEKNMSLVTLRHSSRLAARQGVFLRSLQPQPNLATTVRSALSVLSFPNSPRLEDKSKVQASVTARNFASPAKANWAPAADITSVTPFREEKVADHSWRQVNRIWSDEEIVEKMNSKNMKHVPITASDKIMRNVMRTMYHSFNFITGYQHKNPSAKSIEWRLIILESFAGTSCLEN